MAFRDGVAALTEQMEFQLTSLADLNAAAFDQIIDVRSPSEYAIDHLPGAINLPVLSDAERAQVGAVYVQDSRFTARKMGAALVARNAATHLDGALKDKDGGYRPLVYCWRGGQRSASFAGILAQIGWRVRVLNHGYRAYRRLVVRTLYDDPFPAPVVVLGGHTGTAKTEILCHIDDLGVQVINLEGLANHRGSLFGGRKDPQPSQKAFERKLAQVIGGLSPDRPVIVEAESSRIGNLTIPPMLWAAMRQAPRIRLEVPLEVRAAYLATNYRDITADPEHLRAVIEKLRPLHSRDRIDHWLELAGSGDFTALALSLMEHHYDPRYKRSDGHKGAAAQTVLSFDDLSPGGLQRAARSVDQKISGVLPDH